MKDKRYVDDIILSDLIAGVPGIKAREELFLRISKEVIVPAIAHLKFFIEVSVFSVVVCMCLSISTYAWSRGTWVLFVVLKNSLISFVTTFIRQLFLAVVAGSHEMVIGSLISWMPGIKLGVLADQ